MAKDSVDLVPQTNQATNQSPQKGDERWATKRTTRKNQQGTLCVPVCCIWSLRVAFMALQCIALHCIAVRCVALHARSTLIQTHSDQLTLQKVARQKNVGWGDIHVSPTCVAARKAFKQTNKPKPPPQTRTTTAATTAARLCPFKRINNGNISPSGNK